jgi:hypothetical protein
MRKLRSLKEAEFPEYPDIFGPETVSNLKARSERKYQRDILSNEELRGINWITLYNEIAQAEKGYEKVLSDLAVKVVKEQFPELDYLFKDFPFKINAKIAKAEEISALTKKNIPTTSEIPKNLSPDDKDKVARIKNAITQGASVREITFKAIEDAVNMLDPDMVARYNNLIKKIFGELYMKESNIKLLLQVVSTPMAAREGYSMPDVEYRENSKGEMELVNIVVFARAKIFPTLVHEAIKSLFSLLQTQGMDDSEDSEAVVQRMQRVGTLENEPRDIEYGQHIYESFEALLSQYDPTEDSLVRLLFLIQIFKLEKNPKEFIAFIKNLLDENLTADQLRWCEQTVKNIQQEVKRYRAEKSLKQGGNMPIDEINLTEAPKSVLTGYTASQITDLFNNLMNFDEGELEEVIKKQGSKYTLYSHSGKKLGTHPSKEAARKQERAIYASKAKNESTSCSCGCNTCNH